MDCVEIHLDEHGASLHFSDGHREDIQRLLLNDSGLLQRMLPDSKDQPYTTLTAPCGVLRAWLFLKSMLASPDSIQTLTCNILIEYLQVASFMADTSAIHNLSGLLAAQLFKSISKAAQTFNSDGTSEEILQVLGPLPDDLVTEVLKCALDNNIVTIHDIFALMPGPLDVAVLQVAFSELFRSRTLDIDCFKYPIAATSACLAHMSRFLNARHLTVKLAAHRHFYSSVSVNLRRSLESALDHAAQNNVAVELHIEVSCPQSLKHLLKYTIPGGSTIRKLTLCDTPAASTKYRSPSRAFWDCVHPGCYPGLQSLALLHSPSTQDLHAQIDLHQLRMTSKLACFTGLTQLYIHDSMPASQPVVFLQALSQLQDLDACFAVHDTHELSALQSALSGLPQLTRLALSDTRSQMLHRLLYVHETMFPEESFQEFYSEIDTAQKDKNDRMRALCIGPVRMMWLQVPLTASLQHLDLSSCYMNDEMLGRLTPQLQEMAASGDASLQHLALSVLHPGAAMMDLLKALQTFPQVTELCIESEIPCQRIGDLEGLICSLTSLQKLSLYDVYTQETFFHPPMLTVLTGLSTLFLRDSMMHAGLVIIPAAVADISFFRGLGQLSNLQTLSLSSLPLYNVFAMDALATSLQSLQNLGSLELSFAYAMNEDGAHVLSTGLATLHQLTHIQLLSATGGRACHVWHELCVALHHMSCLASLSLQGLPLTADSCSALGQALMCAALSGLQQLRVEYCTVDNEGYKALAQALDSNTHSVATEPAASTTGTSHGHLGLTKLTWSHNHLAEADCVHLARILSMFPNLQHCNLLDLHLSRMHECAPIENALVNLKKLQHLDLKKNGQWSPIQLKAMCSLPLDNPHLRSVDIENVSPRQIQHDGPTGWSIMCEAEEALQLEKDPMKCLNLQAIAGAYNDFWRTAIRVSVAGVGLLMLGACLHGYRRCTQVRPHTQSYSK